MDPSAPVRRRMPRPLVALLFVVVTTTIGWFGGRWWGRATYEACRPTQFCFGEDWDEFWGGAVIAAFCFVGSSAAVGVWALVRWRRRRARRRQQSPELPAV